MQLLNFYEKSLLTLSKKRKIRTFTSGVQSRDKTKSNKKTSDKGLPLISSARLTEIAKKLLRYSFITFFTQSPLLSRI